VIPSTIPSPPARAAGVTGNGHQILDEIAAELRRQHELWGRQLHQPLYWHAILAEEAGEVAKALVDGDLGVARTELIQVAAVAVAFASALDDGQQNDP
jgi:hypothetical protein